MPKILSPEILSPRILSPEILSPRILSLSCVYPNPSEPQCGLFVRARLRAMARRAELRVIAPVIAGRARAPIPFAEFDGATGVLHPRWLHPPGAGALNPLAMVVAIAGTVDRCRREFPFDWIDAHFAYPDGVVAVLLALRYRVPVAITLRGSEVEHNLHPLRRAWMRWALRRARRVIAVAGNLRRLAISLGADPARIATIPNGVDAAVFHPRDRAACRAQFGLATDIPVVLSAGHLIELKGHHRIAEAFEGLPAAARLVIAGDSGRGASYEASIRAAAARAGVSDRVQFLGALPPGRLAELMCAADVVCLASSREGCPNVVAEALACGTPVVASAVGAVPEMIPSPCYGTVVPAADNRALQHALRVALERDWDRDAISAWGRSRSWEATGDAVIDFLGSR